MKDEIKEILENIQYAIEEDDYWEVTKETLKPLLDYITNLQQEISHLRQNKARTLEYIENNRIREKCIVDVNTLEGLLNE